MTTHPAPPVKPSSPANSAAKAGIGFGCALAIVLSWTTHQSLFWVLVHGVLGWLYVLYFLLTNDQWSWF